MQAQLSALGVVVHASLQNLKFNILKQERRLYTSNKGLSTRNPPVDELGTSTASLNDLKARFSRRALIKSVYDGTYFDGAMC